MSDYDEYIDLLKKLEASIRCEREVLLAHSIEPMHTRECLETDKILKEINSLLFK